MVLTRPLLGVGQIHGIWLAICSESQHYKCMRKHRTWPFIP